MEEGVYRTMKSVGITSMVLGIIGIVFGIAMGVSFIVNGARLLSKRKDLTF